jgi:hypothetical protein
MSDSQGSEWVYSPSWCHLKRHLRRELGLDPVDFKTPLFSASLSPSTAKQNKVILIYGGWAGPVDGVTHNDKYITVPFPVDCKSKSPGRR